MPSASILIPTRARPDYLEVTLTSVVPQALAADAEVIVISDGHDSSTAEIAARHGVRLLTLPAPRGLNAARNAGAAAARSELAVFLDDDVLAPAGWLEALLQGARAAPEVDVYGGPIRALLEGGGPRCCGREPAPITTLELGERDRDVEFVWGANMAIRRPALGAVGPFDESIWGGRGDEEEWLRRYAARGGRVRYLARAGLHHRRSAADASLRSLARAQYWLGRAARRNDERAQRPKPLRSELRVLVGCGWHTVRRRCGYGVVLLVHTAGKLHEALAASSPPPGVPDDFAIAGSPPPPAPDDFLSGSSGTVLGLRARSRALARDVVADAASLPRRTGLREAAAASPSRRVLALAVQREDAPNLLAAARAELARTHHRVELFTRPAGTSGKFENLNALLAEHPPDGYDWLLVIDDDVALPRGFLDEFLFLAERHDLRLAQPAHRHLSHAAWQVTRRRAWSVVRETAFVEIGPVTAFHSSTFEALLPFPPLRYGWGLDAHWAAVARERGWRLGIVDATPVRHGLRAVAASYRHADAIEEGREFLRGRAYVPANEAQRTLATHRSW